MKTEDPGMTRQQIDHNHTSTSDARLKRYAKIEMAQRPSAASKTLQRRAKSLPGDARLNAFLKIDRRKGD